MKALTLRHPWAWCVARAGKDIENRTWCPGAALHAGEWFAIHGGVIPRGTSKAWREFEDDFLSVVRRGLVPPGTALSQTLTPGVVCVVRFGGTVRSSPSPWFCGPVGWKLLERFALPEPVEIKGGRGLWDLPADALAEVRRQARGSGFFKREKESVK
jgi:hypothetical protein